MRSVWLTFFPPPPNHIKDFMLQECKHFCLFYLLLYSRQLEQCFVNGTHSVTSFWIYEACYSAKAFVKFRPMGQKESGINFFDFSNFKYFFFSANTMKKYSVIKHLFLSVNNLYVSILIAPKDNTLFVLQD